MGRESKNICGDHGSAWPSSVSLAGANSKFIAKNIRAANQFHASTPKGNRLFSHRLEKKEHLRRVLRFSSATGSRAARLGLFLREGSDFDLVPDGSRYRRVIPHTSAHPGHAKL
eukprot:3775300-Pleurochrysis_carterae.AAC.2